MRIDVRTDTRADIVQAILATVLAHRLEPRAIETVPRHVYIDLPQLNDETLPALAAALRDLPGVLELRRITAMPRELRRLQLEAVLDSLDHPLFAVNAAGTVVVANAAAVAASGRSETALLGTDIAEVIGAGDWQAASEEPGETQPAAQAILGDRTYSTERLPIFDGAADGVRKPVGTLLILRTSDRPPRPQATTERALLAFDDLQGDTAAFREAVDAAQHRASDLRPVLFQGERGTGKRTLAGALHLASACADGPFVVVDCSAVAIKRLECLLFGGPPGTSGSRDGTGILEQRLPGTVVLHEIEALPVLLQWRVRDLLDSERSTGGVEKRQSPRLIFTAAGDLATAAVHSRIDAGLLERLQPGSIQIPALRDRRGDIPILTNNFLNAAAASRGQPMPGITPAALSLLAEASWPGNVRQLEDTMWQAAVQSPDKMVDVDVLEGTGYDTTETTVSADLPASWADALKEFEADLLRKLYPAHPSSRKLAKRLKLSHTAVANKLRAYGIGSRS